MNGRICAFGDAALDIVVVAETDLVADGDVPADISVVGGGQAANVACWAAALGAAASVVSGTGADAGGALVRSLLAARGVALHGPAHEGGRTATVVSIVDRSGARTMASDRGRRPPGEPPSATSSPTPSTVELDSAWFEGLDWLHLSGYALFSDAADGALAAAAMARAGGATISVDLSSSKAVVDVGPFELRRRLAACGAALVFANQDEAATAGHLDVATVVVKRGAAGFTIHSAGTAVEWSAIPALVRDSTGAGDAFAAGWLVGGPTVAATAARLCVERLGAMPPSGSVAV